MGGERRRREKEKKRERRAFFLGVVASELRHTSLFFPCFLALLYFTCCRVLFLLAPSSFKRRGTLALLPPAIGKLRRKRTQLVQWARKRRAQCFSLSLFSRRGGWNSVVRRLGSSHPPRAPLSSSCPAFVAPRSADNLEFQPLGGKKDVSRLQAAGSGVERASKMERGHQPARQAKRAPAGEESLSFLPTRSFSRCSLSLRHQLFLCGSLLERAFDRRAERRSQRARFGLERGASMLSPLLSRMVLSFFLFPFFPFLPRQLTFNRPPPSLVSTTSA